MTTPSAQNRILDFGIDWLTATSNDLALSSILQEKAADWILEECHAGNETSPWTMMGYEGFKCGGVACGELNGVTLIRLSSDAAWRHWFEAYGLSTNQSRVDVQVTVSGYPDPQREIYECYKVAKKFVGKWTKPPAVDLWTSNNGSATVYLNKRTSDLFCRIYDKGIESKLDHYRGCLRFEMEVKGDACTTLLATVTSGGSPHLDAVGYVSGFLSNRGIVSLSRLAEPTFLKVPRCRSDAARSLEWLEKSVRPCIKSLIERGFLVGVEKALDLSLNGPANSDVDI